ncbi:MAG TPA: GH3 auxin-responsive promoter family protein, partial [Agriterribacter sp.]|nr:GH3 auxin-responsive promoter family protein [Agriterribacter sp.]
MGLIEIPIPKTLARTLKLHPGPQRRQQGRVLKKLLKKARYTEFGQAYHFDEILLHKHPEKIFQQLVPVFDYDSIYAQWWHRTLDGIPDVCWPGKIEYFALSSGTSGSASKY